MRWSNARQSGNVVDRRGMSRGMVAGGGVGTLVLVLIVWLLGGDPRALLNEAGTGGPLDVQIGGGTNRPVSPEEEQLVEFVRTVLASTEDVWNDLLPREGNRPYQQPRLVLFSGGVQSACGLADSAVGPFYCPGDGQVYLDLSFFNELARRFRAPGDFAQAYVIAHEIGHHVQNQLGLSDKVHAMRNRVSETEYNQLSVRLELQADFLAGVWAHHAQRTGDGMKLVLDAGDLEEALAAASAIGDDTLQKRARGYVMPDSFTHGSSAQRLRWFKKGFESGRLADGDTFAQDEL